MSGSEFVEMFVVMGEKHAQRIGDGWIITKNAIDEILKYYHYKPSELPESITDPDEQLDYCLRPYGLMRRSVELKKGWYKDAYGPLLAFRKDDGSPVALLPGTIHGYFFRDPATGKTVRLNAETEQFFDSDAICFYRPLPLKKLGIPDLLLYMKNCISTSDFFMIVFAAISVSGVGLLIPRLTKALTGPVLSSGRGSALIGLAICLVCVSLSVQLFSTVNAMCSNRLETKITLGVQASMMMRLMSLPASFFRQYSPGELNNRSSSVNQLCVMLMSMVMTTGLTSLTSLLYVTQIFRFAPKLVVPSLLIVLVTVGFSVVTTLVQIGYTRRRMEHTAKESGMSAAQIQPVLEMAEPFLKTVPETQEKKEIVTRLGGSVELSHVSFRYDEDSPYILNDLSLKIKAGEYVAVVGRTGCGKSTLMRLLLGFEKPDKGAIYYDGRDIESLDLGSLRRKIGTVMQQSGLFQGDIYSNIVLTAPGLSIDDAWEAAEKAGIADDIRAMPMGMYTMVSEGGGGISGGQKQRLMIARAIAPKPKLLFFDEATSALDNKTQKQVSEALDAMGCTRVVIAHRLSTIRHCDRILVLDGGQIVEDGSYEELIEKGGYFADLVERQRVDAEA